MTFLSVGVAVLVSAFAVASGFARAYERERFIAHRADRRGAHFRQLTRPQSDLAFVRVVATGTPRDRELGAGDS
jgi:hypothetical protein